MSKNISATGGERIAERAITERDTALLDASQAASPLSRSPRLIPLTQWPEHHAWPPLGGLRHLVFHEHTNGFSRCVRRVGRRVLIDEAEFFRWVESQRERGVD